MSVAVKYEFPAVKGIQAGRDCYIAMVPMPIIPRLFPYPPPSENLKARDRSQRVINKARVRKLANYIRNQQNGRDYTLPAITVVINDDVVYDHVRGSEHQESLGVLKFAVAAELHVVDGQHRCAAISEVVGYTDDFNNEDIAVLFFVSKDLKKRQQMFADLNRHASKPTKAIGILFEHRDEYPVITKMAIERTEAFKGFVNEESNTLNKTSGKLFTLNAIYDSNIRLLRTFPIDSGAEIEVAVKLIVEFWDAADRIFPQWKAVRSNTLNAREVREDYIHTHAVSLCAIGQVGNYLLRHYSDDWKTYLKKLRKIDWSRNNTKLWDGRCLMAGQLKNTSVNITLVSNVLKQFLKIELNENEQNLENDFKRGR